MCIRDRDKINSNQIAIIDDSGHQMTYGDICTFVKKLETVQLERSVLFCLCENTASALAGIIAFESLGVVPLLVSASIEKELLTNLNSIYAPSYYWTPESCDIQPKGVTIFSENGYKLIRTGNKPLSLIHIFFRICRMCAAGV